MILNNDLFEVGSVTKSQSKNGNEQDYQHPRTQDNNQSDSSSQPDHDQVLYASPMSILNQPEDNSLYLRRKSSMDVDVRKNMNKAPEYEFRKPRTQVEQYGDRSDKVVKRKGAMPITEQKLRKLERTLETSRSRYIARLMQGNSAIIPSSRRRDKYRNHQ